MPSVILRPAQPWGNVVQLGNKTYPGPLYRRRAGGRLTFSPLTTTWLANVEAADLAGGEPPLEDEVYNAMGVFADWRIPLGGACCLMIGPRTLAGALVPMVGPAPTGVNLVTGDYNRARIQFGGIKRLSLGFTSTLLPQDDCHVALSIVESFVTTGGAFLFGGLNIPGYVAMFTTAAGSVNLRVRLQSDEQIVPVLTGGPVVDGIYTVRRLSAAEVRVITPTQDYVSSNSSIPQVDHPMNFAANGNGGAVAPLKSYFFSCGPGLDTVELRSRVTSLADAITAALA